MKIRIISFLSIVAAAAVVILFMTNKSVESMTNEDLKPLPIINPIDIKTKFLVDPEVRNIGQGHKIKDYSLIDQNGEVVENSFTNGHIYVADFFFTTCGGICPTMTKQLKRVQSAYKNDDNIKLISHSVWPSVDSVPRMRAYADKYEAIDDKWKFLTGDKKEIYALARKSYMVAPAFDDTTMHHEGEGLAGGPDDFIHTQWFTLVDPDRRIRGYYDGTNEEEISKLIKDIKKLKKEYKL